MQKHPVKGGAWSAYLEGQSPPTVSQKDGFVLVTADLGWGGNDLSCYVYSEVIDAGASSFKMLQAAAKSVQFKKLAPYFLNHVKLDPIVGTRGLYHVEQEAGLAAGDFKLMVMPRSEHPVMCVHDAPGYAESFARVTTEFAESFEFKSEIPSPARGELWRASLEGVPVGFSVERTYELEGGGLRFVSLSANFTPTGPGELSFHDKATILDMDREGVVESGTFVSFKNSESNMELELQRDGGKYSYSGTVDNQETKGTFKAKQPIKGAHALRRQVKKLAAAKKPTSIEQWEYHPSLDPSQALKATYELTPENNGITVLAKLGQQSMVFYANAQGVVSKGQLPMGSQTVELTLLEEAGGL